MITTDTIRNAKIPSQVRVRSFVSIIRLFYDGWWWMAVMPTEPPSIRWVEKSSFAYFLINRINSKVNYQSSFSYQMLCRLALMSITTSTFQNFSLSCNVVCCMNEKDQKAAINRCPKPLGSKKKWRHPSTSHRHSRWIPSFHIVLLRLRNNVGK